MVNPWYLFVTVDDQSHISLGSSLKDHRYNLIRESLHPKSISLEILHKKSITKLAQVIRNMKKRKRWKTIYNTSKSGKEKMQEGERIQRYRKKRKLQHRK